MLWNFYIIFSNDDMNFNFAESVKINFISTFRNRNKIF